VVGSSPESRTPFPFTSRYLSHTSIRSCGLGGGSYGGGIEVTKSNWKCCVPCLVGLSLLHDASSPTTPSTVSASGIDLGMGEPPQKRRRQTIRRFGASQGMWRAACDGLR